MQGLGCHLWHLSLSFALYIGREEPTSLRLSPLPIPKRSFSPSLPPPITVEYPTYLSSCLSWGFGAPPVLSAMTRREKPQLEITIPQLFSLQLGNALNSSSPHWLALSGRQTLNGSSSLQSKYMTVCLVDRGYWYCTRSDALLQTH